MNSSILENLETSTTLAQTTQQTQPTVLSDTDEYSKQPTPLHGERGNEFAQQQKTVVTDTINDRTARLDMSLR